MVGVLRRLFTFASVLSLLLCAATVVLWIRGYSRSDDVCFNGTPCFLIGVQRGSLLFEYQWPHNDDIPPGYQSITWNSPRSPDWSHWLYTISHHNVCGFALYTFRWRGVTAGARQVTAESVEIPYWFVATVFFSLPAYKLRFHRRGRRIASGLCTACGYNLTGNMSGICPECGTPVNPARA